MQEKLCALVGLLELLPGELAQVLRRAPSLLNRDIDSLRPLLRTLQQHLGDPGHVGSIVRSYSSVRCHGSPPNAAEHTVCSQCLFPHLASASSTHECCCSCCGISWQPRSRLTARLSSPSLMDCMHMQGTAMGMGGVRGNCRRHSCELQSRASAVVCVCVCVCVSLR